MRYLNCWDNKNFWGAKSGPLTNASSVKTQVEEGFSLISPSLFWPFLMIFQSNEIHCSTLIPKTEKETKNRASIKKFSNWLLTFEWSKYTYLSYQRNVVWQVRGMDWLNFFVNLVAGRWRFRFRSELLLPRLRLRCLVFQTDDDLDLGGRRVQKG